MPFIRGLSLTLLACFITTTHVHANALEDHHSPYLAMHGQDPVNWESWGEKALERARKENKLLYVSIGYFACHWCHVMHKESFANPDIAKQLNENYIPVKVDRELNPILDKRLIEFVQVTNGVAGWPLNVFITPEGYPLIGNTYMPREHFQGVLQTIDRVWGKDPAIIKSKAEALNQKLASMLGVLELTTHKQSIAQQKASFITTTMEQAAILRGGFGASSKFPNIPQLNALLTLNALSPNAEVDAFLKRTLDAITQKGLHDVLGGGFFRYTVDAGWKTPHFEKMLYTNAQMPVLLLKAADYFKQPAYRAVALETLDFLSQDMQGKHAFIASLSAVDESGNEGAYYLWSEASIRAILNQYDETLALAAWDLKRSNDLAFGNLPVRKVRIETLAQDLGQSVQKIEADLQRIRHTLLDYRAKNRQLPRDDKQLSGWNGLALHAFAEALPHQSRYQPSGDKLANFLLSVWDGEQLRRSASSQQNGTLLDYAAVANGLLAWADVSKQPRYAAVGAAILDRAWAQFRQGKTWRETNNSLLPDGVAQSHIADTPITSPETLLLQATSRLKSPRMNKRIQEVIAISNRSINADPYAYASLIQFSVDFEGSVANTGIKY